MPAPQTRLRTPRLSSLVAHEGELLCRFCHRRLALASDGLPLKCVCREGNVKRAKTNFVTPQPEPKKKTPQRAAPGQEICRYCSQTVGKIYQTRLQNGATIDHFIPMLNGGRNEPKNSVMACERCNGLKGSINPHSLIEVWNEIDPEGFAQAVAKVVGRFDE